MYGFGDDINPRQDTVELVEDLMIEYIETVVRTSILALYLFTVFHPSIHPSILF